MSSTPLSDMNLARMLGISLSRLLHDRRQNTRRVVGPTMRVFRRELRKALAKA